MGLLVDWIRERVPIRGDQLREMTNEPVPNHLKRWWFCLGGTPAYLFVVQIVTGILLAFYYSARRRKPLTNRFGTSPTRPLTAGTSAACTSGAPRS